MTDLLAMQNLSAFQPRIFKVVAFSCSLFISACASTQAGIQGYDNFISESKVVSITGTRPAADAAKCFENNATFLPLSEFSRDGAAGTFTYRLRLAGVWYEQVQISADGSGSRAEVHLSPRLNDKWKSRFETERGSVAARCLGAWAN